MRDILTICHLTLHEAVRRRVLLAALIGGAAFLILFGVGFHFMRLETVNESMLERRAITAILTLAGLFAASRLVIMMAVLLPLDTLSGEIASGVIQTVASKPVRRRDIVLGKWLGHWLVMTGYMLVLVGGVLAIARFIGNSVPPRLERGLPLMILEGTVLLTLSIAGGTRLSTITNGMLAFGLYGIAFIGNWVEQIGTFTDNDAARYLGTVSSLIMPSESMWQLAAALMQPTLMRELGNSPFSPLSVPSAAMVWWALGYTVVVLSIGLRVFQKRPL
jgi:ABC-type transport system involved in multi-copper enzyme maturation permease subunit